MDLTFPLRRRGFRVVADISLPQGRLRGADELIGGRQDLRAREDDHRVRHSRARHHSLAAAWLPTGYGVTVSRRKRDVDLPR